MNHNSMTYIQHFVLLGILMMVLFGASTGCSRHPESRLMRISSFVSDYPERALQTLDSIDSKKLSDSDRHFYDFLTIKAKDKAFVTHDSDSLILDVIEYYSARPSDPIYQEALYYGGRVYSDLGDYPTALQYFKQALDNHGQAPDTTDLKSRLNSQMGTIYQKLRLYDKAIPYFSQMLKQKMAELDSAGIVYAQQGLGTVYYNLGTLSQVDSIRNHYLECADSILTQSLVYAAMLPHIFSADSKVFLAGVKQAKGDIASALTLIRNTPDLVDPIQRNVALAYAADIYLNAGILDTAFMYVHELIQNEDVLNKKTGYRIILSPEFRKNLHPDTLNQYYTDYKDILESYFDNNANEQALIQESQYNYKLHERDKLKEHAANERLRWIIAGVIILALFSTSLLLYVKNRDKATIIRLHDNLERLQKLELQLPSPSCSIPKDPLSDNTSTNQAIANTKPLLREELRKKLTELYEQSQSQEVPKIILNSNVYFRITALISGKKHIDDETFDELKRTVLLASPKFIDNLNILTQNKLTEIDLKTALLIKCGFRPSEMTILFARSNGAVVYRRNALADKVFERKESVDVVNGIIRLL